VDVEHIDFLEGELNRLIERRATSEKKAEADRKIEEEWEASERDHYEALRQRNLLQRRDYHEAQAKRLEVILHSLIFQYQAEAEKCRAQLAEEV
jgi:hypothetical protein